MNCKTCNIVIPISNSLEVCVKALGNVYCIRCAAEEIERLTRITGSLATPAFEPDRGKALTKIPVLGTLRATTHKAYLIKFKDQEFWIPKSQCFNVRIADIAGADSSIFAEVTSWFWERKQPAKDLQTSGQPAQAVSSSPIPPQVPTYPAWGLTSPAPSPNALPF